MADGLAQLVEQRPFKAWVLGSSPRPVTVRKDSHENESLFFIPNDLGLGRGVYTDWSEAEHRQAPGDRLTANRRFTVRKDSHENTKSYFVAQRIMKFSLCVLMKQNRPTDVVLM